MPVDRKKNAEYVRGYRQAVAYMARLIRLTEWDPATRKRLRALTSLMASFPDADIASERRRG